MNRKRCAASNLYGIIDTGHKGCAHSIVKCLAEGSNCVSVADATTFVKTLSVLFKLMPKHDNLPEKANTKTRTTQRAMIANVQKKENLMRFIFSFYRLVLENRKPSMSYCNTTPTRNIMKGSKTYPSMLQISLFGRDLWYRPCPRHLRGWDRIGLR